MMRKKIEMIVSEVMSLVASKPSNLVNVREQKKEGNIKK